LNPKIGALFIMKILAEDVCTRRAPARATARGQRSARGLATLALAVAPCVGVGALSACAGARGAPLHCSDGALPCADQVTAFHCDETPAGVLPPDEDDVRWMLAGAKIPPRDEPPVALTSWCDGTIEAAGMRIRVELFQDIDGGYMTLPGGDRFWFEAPPEEPREKAARMCTGGALPRAEELAKARCHGVASDLGFDARSATIALGRARVAGADTFGGAGDPLGYCLYETNGVERRIDFFEGGKGWLRLPSARRVCFVPG
jgi:hypothetical protein